ncbi:MAG: TetR/AcrR family transcriptional regulator [Planctomycetaceae bacterium]
MLINSNSPKKLRPGTARRRREILDAALECFLKQGVEGTSIEQIRKLSGASHGSIYHLFESKNAIACTLFLEGVERYQNLMLDQVRNTESPRGKMEVMIRTHLKYSHEHPALALYLSRMGLSDLIESIEKQYRLLREKFVQAIYEEFVPFIERGQLLDLDSHYFFLQITGPCSQLARAWLVRQTEIRDIIAYTEQLTSCAWNSLKKEEGASLKRPLPFD